MIQILQGTYTDKKSNLIEFWLLDSDSLGFGCSMSTCDLVQQPDLDQTESKNPKLHLGLPHKSQVPKYWGHHLLPSKRHKQETGLKTKQLELEHMLHTIGDAGIVDGDLTH